MNKVENVLVIGAGIGGLGAAAALGQRGVDVDVVDIRPHSTVLGVGINQPANSLRALKKIGVLDEILAAGVVFDRYTFYDYKGELIVDVRSRMGGDDVPANCALARRDLHDILIGAADRAGAGVRYGTTVTELSDAGDRVDVEFSDGTSASYDVVVAFDGIKSQTRRRLFGDTHEPVYTGSGVWRVTTPRLPGADFLAVFQSQRNKAGHIPLTGESMYLLLVCEEPADARYAKEDFYDLLQERLEPYEGPIAEVRDDLMKKDDDIVYSPLSEVFLPDCWHKGRVALGGDAAHACTPHITQGAAMALEDAVVFAEEVAGATDVEAALLAYGKRRYPRAKFVQEVSRGILDAERAVTRSDLAVAAQHMAAEIPGQFAEIDDFLKQPA